jgi:hypothetical protein
MSKPPINAVKFRVANVEKALEEVIELLRPAAQERNYAGPDVAQVEQLARLVGLMRQVVGEWGVAEAARRRPHSKL